MYLDEDGVLEVRDNVVFKANTATHYSAGAVSLPFETGFDLPVVVLCNTF